jgi:hypothetical protein
VKTDPMLRWYFHRLGSAPAVPKRSGPTPKTNRLGFTEVHG